MRQKSRVNTHRQRSGVGALFCSSPLWTASLVVYYRAPENEFAAWEPVLCGIMDSSRQNLAWQMGERRLAENFIANAQQDIQRRTRQISQTLSETSDMINLPGSHGFRGCLYFHALRGESIVISFFNLTLLDPGAIMYLGSSRRVYRSIYVMNADGSQPFAITTSGNVHSPVWSPDGASILFALLENRRYRVCLINADGSGQRVQFDVAERRVIGLAWRPGG